MRSMPPSRSVQPGRYDLLPSYISIPNLIGFELYRKTQWLDPIIIVMFLTTVQIYREKFEKIFPSADVTRRIPLQIIDLSF